MTDMNGFSGVIHGYGSLPLAVMLLLLVLGAGCATAPGLKNVSQAEQQRVLSGASLALDAERIRVAPDVDVMGLTEDMKAFVRKAVSQSRTGGEKLKALLEAVVSPRRLGLVYDGTASYTASETYRHRRANCLSFTTMIIAMLRYAGFHAEFNNVDIPPIWDLQNNNMLVMYRHVNTIVSWPGGGREVVDINMDEYNFHYPQHSVRDEVAIAQFYNNRGVEFLLQGNITDAFRYLRKAISLAAEVPYLWVNMGALYRNQGLLQDAEIAYRKALEADPVNLVAISGAERIYKDLGMTELSAKFARQAQYFRERNPYYMYTVARQAFLAGDYSKAIQDINAAIRRYDEEHRFYFLQGVIYKALGESVLAQTSFDMAIKLSASDKQADKYRSKLQKIM